MELRKGDLIAVTISRTWIQAVGKIPMLYFFPGNDTETARTCVAKIVSVTHTDGLWLETASDEPKDIAERRKILIPWTYIIAVQTGEGFLAERRKAGFETPAVLTSS